MLEVSREFIFRRLRKTSLNKIGIIKLLFCLFVVTRDTKYGHISSTGDIGNLPEAKCRNDPGPLWK